MIKQIKIKLLGMHACIHVNLPLYYWAIPEKVQTGGGGGEVEDTEFLGLYTEEKVCGNPRGQLIK